MTKVIEGRRTTLERVLLSLDFLAKRFDNTIIKYKDYPFISSYL